MTFELKDGFWGKGDYSVGEVWDLGILQERGRWDVSYGRDFGDGGIREGWGERKLFKILVSLLATFIVIS